MRYSLLTAAALASSTALATPMASLLRRDNGTAAPAPAPAGCIENTGQRQCYTAGDRTLQCIDWTQSCPVGYSSPYIASDEDANRAACVSKSEGDACTTVWTCCSSA